MKTKAELAAKIEKLQAKHDAMPDDVVLSGVVYDEPIAGANVWCLFTDGSVNEWKYSGWEGKLNNGMLFHDKESALRAGKVRAIRHRLAGFCDKAWQEAGQVMDWNDREQGKYLIYWDYNTSQLKLCKSHSNKYGEFHLPSGYLMKLKIAFTHNELKIAFTHNELKMAIAGES
jgi:hypothetical protein